MKFTAKPNSWNRAFGVFVAVLVCITATPCFLGAQERQWSLLTKEEEKFLEGSGLGAAMESVDADEHFELLGQFALGHKLTPSVEILAVDYVFASRSVKLAEHEFNRIDTSDAVEGIRGIAVWRIPVKGPGAVMSFRVIAKSMISNGSEDLVVGCRTFSFDGEVWKEIDGQSALPIKSRLVRRICGWIQ